MMIYSKSSFVLQWNRCKYWNMVLQNVITILIARYMISGNVNYWFQVLAGISCLTQLSADVSHLLELIQKPHYSHFQKKNTIYEKPPRKN